MRIGERERGKEGSDLAVLLRVVYINTAARRGCERSKFIGVKKRNRRGMIYRVVRGLRAEIEGWGRGCVYLVLTRGRLRLSRLSFATNNFAVVYYSGLRCLLSGIAGIAEGFVGIGTVRVLFCNGTQSNVSQLYETFFLFFVLFLGLGNIFVFLPEYSFGNMINCIGKFP